MLGLISRAVILMAANENAVLGTRRVHNFNISEAGLQQHLSCSLFTPDGSEPGALHGERYRHAVHQAESVVHRREWITDVLLKLAAELEVDHQECSTWLQ